MRFLLPRLSPAAGVSSYRFPLYKNEFSPIDCLLASYCYSLWAYDSQPPRTGWPNPGSYLSFTSRRTCAGRLCGRMLFMRRFSFALLVSIFFSASFFAQTPQGSAPTYTKDVAPILQKHCQTCHRPGDAGTFSMLTSGATKPVATTMKRAVRQKVMPP